MPVVSSYTSILGANLADGDDFLVVDVSDTTQAVTGTTKRVTKSELASVIGNDPTTLSRLTVGTYGPTGNSSFNEPLHWTALNTVETVGSDIAIDAMDDTKINILTDGVYAISIPNAEVDGPNITWATLEMDGDPNGGLVTPFQLEDPNGVWNAVWSQTYFYPAGQVISFQISAVVGSGTWDITSVLLRVQRVA